MAKPTAIQMKGEEKQLWWNANKHFN